MHILLGMQQFKNILFSNKRLVNELFLDIYFGILYLVLGFRFNPETNSSF